MTTSPSMSNPSWMLVAAAATDVGRRRAVNEDGVCNRPDLGLFIVTDGMGGEAAGDVASRLAIQSMTTFVVHTHDPDIQRAWPVPYDDALGRSGNRLNAAFVVANRRIAAATAVDPTLEGMATTAVAVLLADGDAAVAHVGDSRLYVWRGDRLSLATADHSLVGEQLRAGMIDEAQARRHPWRHVVTRALSGQSELQVDVASYRVESGDRLLLCSDGLSGVVDDETMAAILARDETTSARCHALVDAANAAGGPDNITAIVVDVE